MSEEKMRVLKMLEEGKISTDEAAKLLAAVEPEGKVGIAACCGPGTTRKVLHIAVQGEGDDKPKVNVNVPLELIKVAMGLIPAEARKKMEEKGISLEKIAEMIDTGIQGKIVEVEHEKNGGKERVIVEIE